MSAADRKFIFIKYITESLLNYYARGINELITILSQKFANEQVVNYALPRSNRDVHVVGFLAESVEVVLPFAIFSIP